MANLNTGLMMLVIYLRLKFKLREYFLSKWRYVAIYGVIIFSIVISFLPFNDYKKCKAGQYEAYCGACFTETQYWQQAVKFTIFVLPAALGAIATALVWMAAYRLKKMHDLSKASRCCLLMQFMPLINIGMIFVHSIVSLLLTKNAMPFFVRESSFWNHVIVFLDEVFFVSSFVNWFYFVLFTRKGMLFTFRIKRLRWMFFMGPRQR